ncbi:MAG: hypothetical protein QNI87_08260 [Erythrobacter sp.]|nr:hypothetical protein [Erythrobacter sp.]
MWLNLSPNRPNNREDGDIYKRIDEKARSYDFDAIWIWHVTHQHAVRVRRFGSKELDERICQSYRDGDQHPIRPQSSHKPSGYRAENHANAPLNEIAPSSP